MVGKKLIDVLKEAGFGRITTVYLALEISEDKGYIEDISSFENLRKAVTKNYLLNIANAIEHNTIIPPQNIKEYIKNLQDLFEKTIFNPDYVIKVLNNYKQKVSNSDVKEAIEEVIKYLEKKKDGNSWEEDEDLKRYLTLAVNSVLARTLYIVTKALILKGTSTSSTSSQADNDFLDFFEEKKGKHNNQR